MTEQPKLNAKTVSFSAFYICKYKKKFVILQAIGIIKSKEARVVAYTCRYSSRYVVNPYVYYSLKQWPN